MKRTQPAEVQLPELSLRDRNHRPLVVGDCVEFYTGTFGQRTRWRPGTVVGEQIDRKPHRVLVQPEGGGRVLQLLPRQVRQREGETLPGPGALLLDRRFAEAAALPALAPVPVVQLGRGEQALHAGRIKEAQWRCTLAAAVPGAHAAQAAALACQAEAAYRLNWFHEAGRLAHAALRAGQESGFGAPAAATVVLADALRELKRCREARPLYVQVLDSYPQHLRALAGQCACGGDPPPHAATAGVRAPDCGSVSTPGPPEVARPGRTSRRRRARSLPWRACCLTGPKEDRTPQEPPPPSNDRVAGALPAPPVGGRRVAL